MSFDGEGKGLRLAAAMAERMVQAYLMVVMIANDEVGDWARREQLGGKAAGEARTAKEVGR